MKRVIILHRWEGGPNDDWRPWLKDQLEKLNFKVEIPQMPDTDTPVIARWVNHLSKIVGQPDDQTYFIGHSIGCQAILRYLEGQNPTIGGAIFVSGWFNLKNLEDDEVKEIAEPWITIPIDLNKVKQVLPKSALIISDNDPYNYYEENVEKFKQLGSEIINFHNAGHITENDGFKELPQALAKIKEISA